MRLRSRVLILFLSFFTGLPSFAKEEFPYHAKINSKGAYIRTDSRVNSQIINTLNKDDIVVVTGQLYEWYKIRLPKSIPCYVFAKYISALSEKVGVVTANGVNIRLKPDTKSPIIGELNKDQVVNIVEFKDNWYMIEPPDEAFAWIHKSTATYIPQSVNNPVILPTTPDLRPEENKDIVTLEGELQDRGKTLGLFNKSISHKLATVDNKIYFLKGNRYTLDMYTNSKVKITGYIIEDIPKQKYPVIEIVTIERLN